MPDYFKESLTTCDNFIESDYTQMWISNGLLYLMYKDNVVCDLNAAKKVLEDRLKLCNGIPYPVFNHCLNVKFWTKEAREFQNTSENYKLYTAAAILYSENIVANIIINFYLKFTTPLIPAKFFTNQHEAYLWINRFVLEKDFKL